MRKHNAKTFLIFSALVISIIAVFFIFLRGHTVVTDTTQSKPLALTTPTPTPTTLPTNYLLPATLLHPVPFTPQAPTANWDALHNEACEEASVIMAAEYFSGNHSARLEPELVEEQITKLTDWEEENFGYHLDINTRETVQMIETVYGLQTKILENYTEEDLKQELSQGRLILLPANGVNLGNPNFRSPGPPYHMIVIKGYNETNFITNDPGTRKGLNYPYTFNTLYNANGDFDHATHKVDLDKKMVIVVWR